ncbi:STAS domain-containing protein [Streptomyces noursei]
MAHCAVAGEGRLVSTGRPRRRPPCRAPLDCCGLSALLAAARAAKTDGVEFRLCTVPRALARLLRLSPTGSAFTIEEPSVR